MRMNAVGLLTSVGVMLILVRVLGSAVVGGDWVVYPANSFQPPPVHK